MANGHGGRRFPRGGKPKGYKSPHTLEKLEAREYTRRLVTAALEPLVTAQIQNALGLKYLVTRDKNTGKFIRVTEAMAKAAEGSDEEIIEVWEKEPSVDAFKSLMDRALDKPKEQEQVHVLELGVSEAILSRLDAWKLRNRLEAEKARAIEGETVPSADAKPKP